MENFNKGLLLIVVLYFLLPCKSTAEGETITEVIKNLRQELPTNFSIKSCDNLVIATNVSASEIDKAITFFEKVKEAVISLICKERQIFSSPIRIYYFKTQNEYKQFYKKLFKEDPRSLIGTCDFSTSRIFGSLDVGDGTLTHELVHIYVMYDWTDIPGWLNESLSVTLGCPKVGILAGKYYITDFHLYVALKAIKQKKWIPLSGTFQHIEKNYDYDNIEIKFDNNLTTMVGPLATGRMFIRWLQEKALLSKFYQKYRDSKDINLAIRSIFTLSGNKIEDDFVNWIKSHNENELLVDINKVKLPK